MVFLVTRPVRYDTRITSYGENLFGNAFCLTASAIDLFETDVVDLYDP